MIQHYSKSIQNQIQSLLFQAKESIKIAVAWFTNDLLFQPLLLKLQTGVSVELILNHDDINCSENNKINFDDFVAKGGVLRWNKSDTLLHTKYCIIDSRIVITGSYNWTNKAEYHDEQITVFIDEKETTSHYSKQFALLSNKHEAIQQKYSTKKKINKTESTKHQSSIFFDTLNHEYQTDPKSYTEGFEYDNSVGFFAKTGYSQDKTALLYCSSSFDYKIIHINNGTKVICDKAFLNRKVKGVIIPETLEVIGKMAFYNNVELTEIVIPNSIKKIEQTAFFGCLNLSKISVVQPNRYFDSRNNCNAIINTSKAEIIHGCRNTIFPDSVQSIAPYACAALDLGHITFQKNIKSIHSGAFYDCNILSLTFSNSNIRLSDESFFRCNIIEFIFVPKGSKNYFLNYFPSDIHQKIIEVYTDDAGALYRENHVLFSGPQKASCYTIMDGTVEISEKAFYNNQNLSRIVFPSTLKTIGNRAFEGCKKLSEITLPTGLVSIGDYAFCSSQIKKVALPNALEAIGSHAFENCPLEEIKLPNKLIYLGAYAFYNCPNLLNVILSKSISEIPRNAFSHTSFHNIKLHSGIKYIGDSAFCYNKKLEWIILPDTIEHIGKHPFQNTLFSNRIMSLRNTGPFPFFPNSLLSIGDEAFSNFTNLYKVEFPKSLRNIGIRAFYLCEKLNTIIFPNKIDLHIGAYAFSFCKSLSSFFVPFESEITFSIGCFNHCHNLRYVALSGRTSVNDKCFTDTRIEAIIVPLGYKSKFQEDLPTYKNKIIEFKRYSDDKQLSKIIHNISSLGIENALKNNYDLFKYYPEFQFPKRFF